MKPKFENRLCKECRNLVLSERKLTIREFQELKECRCLQMKYEIKFKVVRK